MTPEDLIRYGYVWNGQKPATLQDTERRDLADPYCPRWCPYQCTGSWKTGHCLIRIPEAVKAMIPDPCSGRSCDECEIGGCGS